MSNIIALHKLDKELQQSVIPDSLPQAFDISNQQDTAFYFFPARMQSERFISKDKKGETLVSMQERSLKSGNEAWQGFILFGIFAVVVLSKYLYPRRFLMLLQASWSNTSLQQLNRDWNPTKSFISLVFIILYGLSLTQLVTTSIGSYSESSIFSNREFNEYLYVFLSFSALVLFKYILILLMAWLFNSASAGLLHFTNQVVFNFVSVLVLLPLLFVLQYSFSYPLLYFSFVLYGLVQVFRLFRTIRFAGLIRAIPLHYLFLYLCALEIVPPLLLIKAIVLLTTGVEFH